MKKIIYILLLISLVSCKTDTTEIQPVELIPFYVPTGFPQPNFDHKITQERFELGRALFYENRIAKENKIACATCHIQKNAFTTITSSIGFGFNGEPTIRNILPLQNIAFYENFLWDGGGHNLEEMLYDDLTSPVFFNNDTLKILEFLENDSIYNKMFKSAFGNDARPHAYLVAKAIADFVRCLISDNSKYDRYKKGDKSAMNAFEIQGMNLFFSDSVNCTSCHSGPLFSDFKFHNTGVYTHYWDRGRYYVTNEDVDRYKFRTSSLRNIAKTPPYLHDGQWYTLEEVINNYNIGGKHIMAKDPLMRPLNLNDNQIKALIAFLNTLTDDEFINNKKFSK
jgi:cytochrome c peroxidase